VSDNAGAAAMSAVISNRYNFDPLEREGMARPLMKAADRSRK
jgi:hypothetical protein